MHITIYIIGVLNLSFHTLKSEKRYPPQSFICPIVDKRGRLSWQHIGHIGNKTDKNARNDHLCPFYFYLCLIYVLLFLPYWLLLPQLKTNNLT